MKGIIKIRSYHSLMRCNPKRIFNKAKEYSKRYREINITIINLHTYNLLTTTLLIELLTIKRILSVEHYKLQYFYLYGVKFKMMKYLQREEFEKNVTRQENLPIRMLMPVEVYFETKYKSIT